MYHSFIPIKWFLNYSQLISNVKIIFKLSSKDIVIHFQSGGAVAPQPGGQVPPPQGNIPIDTIRRDEVNAILANQREIVTASRDIK